MESQPARTAVSMGAQERHERNIVPGEAIEARH